MCWNTIVIFSHQKLHHFDGLKVYLLFIPPFLLFTIWTLSIYFNFGPNEIKNNFFRNVTMELYDEDIDKIAFMGPLYFVSNSVFQYNMFSVLDSSREWMPYLSLSRSTWSIYQLYNNGEKLRVKERCIQLKRDVQFRQFVSQRASFVPSKHTTSWMTWRFKWVNEHDLSINNSSGHSVFKLFFHVSPNTFLSEQCSFFRFLKFNLVELAMWLEQRAVYIQQSIQ